MGLMAGLQAADSGIRRLTQSLASFQHAAGSISPTMAAAAMVPSIFRRDTPADIASLKMEQEMTGITEHLFTATGAQAQALAREQARGEQQVRPFTRDTEADRASLRLQQEITEQQMRPFRR